MQKTPLSIRVIFILSRIVHSLTALICLAGIVISISLFTGILVNELDMSLKLPIKSDAKEVSEACFYGQEMDVTFAGAEGAVNFMDLPIIVARTLSIFMILVLSITFFLVHLFFRFVKNVNRGVIFEIDNIKILRKLGIGLLGFYFFLMITTKIWKHGFSANSVISNISLSIFGGNLPILLGGLFLLMLSQIFLRGLEIQKENKLTI